MKKNYLFPYKFKTIGLVLFAVSMLSYVLIFTNILDDDMVKFPTFVITEQPSMSMSDGTFQYTQEKKMGFYEEGMLSEISIVMMLSGLLLASFSREKDEDECIADIRMRTYAWAVKLNTLFAILVVWFTFGFIYLYVMGIFFFIVQPLLFICKFNYELYKFRRSGNEE